VRERWRRWWDVYGGVGVWLVRVGTLMGWVWGGAVWGVGVGGVGTGTWRVGHALFWLDHYSYGGGYGGSRDYTTLGRSLGRGKWKWEEFTDD
jgi:hypothetical protein